MPYEYTQDKVFCEIIQPVLISEGGFVDDPNDPGKSTNYGIAWKYNQGILANYGIHAESQMHSLTIEQAKDIYYHKYYLPSDAAGIPSKRLAYIHLDGAINCGTGMAIKWLKQLDPNPKYFEAGAGKNDALFWALFMHYYELRLAYYTRLKNRKYYLEGWVNRMVHVANIARQLGS